VLFFSFAVKSIKVGDFRRGATCCCSHLVNNPCVALVGISFPPPTKPADEGKTATSSTSYNGLSTTTTNALGHQKTTTKNIIAIWSSYNSRLTNTL
jgi:hypothetical protein